MRTEDGRQEVPFALVAPNATDVSVHGDFNFWEPSALSNADGDGVWMTSMFLPPGRYEYAFVSTDAGGGKTLLPMSTSAASEKNAVPFATSQEVTAHDTTHGLGKRTHSRFFSARNQTVQKGRLPRIFSSGGWTI